jgi:hypothetical protein
MRTQPFAYIPINDIVLLLYVLAVVKKKYDRLLPDRIAS